MILDEIVEFKRKEVAQAKAEVSLAKLKEKLAKKELEASTSFKENLKEEGVSIISEVKKASPSKGVIKANFAPVEIAKEYQAGGASAISVLTDENFFQGKLEYLTEIKKAVDLPLLRKDFIIDAYQLYQSKLAGANAVLLIVAVLEDELIDFIDLAAELGLEVLVEVHNRAELEIAQAVGAEIIGINNRNLQDFSVDIENSIKLSQLIDSDKVIIAESGIKTKADIDYLKESVDGFLIGESLMRSENIQAKLNELIE